MDNKSGEKFNPFLEEPEDLLIADNKEMEEAKKAAGVVSEEEHKERMLQSGDKRLVRETKRREVSEQLKKVQNDLHDVLVGKHGVDNLGHLYNLMKALREYPGIIARRESELKELKKQLGVRFKRTKETAPILDEIADQNKWITKLTREIPLKQEEVKGMILEMGLPENIIIEEIDKMWSIAEAKSKQLDQERKNLTEQLQNL